MLLDAVSDASDVEPPVSDVVRALTESLALDLPKMNVRFAATVANRYAAAIALRDEGVTDERAIARELGCLVRTLRRDVGLVAEVASGSTRLRERLLTGR